MELAPLDGGMVFGAGGVDGSGSRVSILSGFVSTSGRVSSVDGTYKRGKLTKRIEALEKANTEAAKKNIPTSRSMGFSKRRRHVPSDRGKSRCAWVGGKRSQFPTCSIIRQRVGAENMNYFMQMDFGFFRSADLHRCLDGIYGCSLYWGTYALVSGSSRSVLEVVSSFRYTTMIERSSLFQAFTPFRHNRHRVLRSFAGSEQHVGA